MSEDEENIRPLIFDPERYPEDAAIAFSYTKGYIDAVDDCVNRVGTLLGEQQVGKLRSIIMNELAELKSEEYIAARKGEN